MKFNGPYVIVCRAHSGGRALSEAFIRNGVQMGLVQKDTKDCKFFGIRSNPDIEELTNMSFEYLDHNVAKKKECINKARDLIQQYCDKDNIDPSKPFGWKFGESLFISPMLMDAFPTCRVIHLIRDGRDVMLSRVPARFEHRINEKFNELIIFGPKRKSSFFDAPFDRDLVYKNRNELELIHWKTCINFGFQCRKYKDQYMEIRYEDFCQDPIGIMNSICSFIETPIRQECIHWIKDNISTKRIGKWKSLSHDQLQLPMSIAGQTLKKLGYEMS